MRHIASFEVEDVDNFLFYGNLKGKRARVFEKLAAKYEST